jgi:hypothetical protein
LNLVYSTPTCALHDGHESAAVGERVREVGDGHVGVVLGARAQPLHDAPLEGGQVLVGRVAEVLQCSDGGGGGGNSVSDRSDDGG